MVKKIIIGVVVLLVLVLCGWKLFFSEGKVDDKFKNLNTTMEAYHTEATMQVGEGEEIRNFFVTVDFKQDEIDNFRISMIDKDINQEQILLRNKDGVYVLTPVLNQVYTFKGDYPLNSPKPYLYHSYIEAIKGKYDVINNADGYTVTFDTNYDNEPNWSKQEIKFSKDLKPVWSYIYDNENNIVVKVIFSKVDFAPIFADDYFTVDANMKNAKDNLSSDHVSTSIDDLPLIPAETNNTTLKEQTKVVSKDGKVSYILTYTGDKSYTVFQKLIEKNNDNDYQSIEVSGKPVSTIYGFGSLQGNCLTYLYHDVSYEIFSKDLTVAEMVNIVTNMERVGVK